MSRSLWQQSFPAACGIALMAAIPQTVSSASLEQAAETTLTRAVAEGFAQAGDQGYEGCFLLADLEGKTVFRSGDACGERFAPCSTFKIPNSIIGLETGAIEADTVMKWDGKKKYLKVWEQDHDLASAIRNSVVWYYQEIARRVGAETMRTYLDRFDYGNQDMSGGLTRFWLDSSLKISADEQIGFLVKLYNDRLPVSKESMATVREILHHSAGEGWQISGKTGSSGSQGVSDGWWVGYVRQGETERLFATRIRGQGAWGPDARSLTLELLANPSVARELGLDTAIPLSKPTRRRGKKD